MTPKETNKELVEAAHANLACALIVADRKGVATFVNSRASALVGHPAKSLLGKPLKSILTLLDSETRAPLNLPALRAFQKNPSIRQFPPSLLVTDKGGEIPVDLTLSPVRDSKGRMLGSALTFCDRTQTMAEERKELKGRNMTVIGSISGSIARDFGHWLADISGHASSIADNLLPKTRTHEEALRILEATEHLGEIIKHLLSVARAGAVEGITRIESVPLANIVADAIAPFEARFAKQGITFKIKETGPMPYIMTDTRQFLDCMNHLFSNAAYAMPDGGTITIDVSDRTVKGQRFAVLRVRDTGDGMPKEILDKIFDPFFSTRKDGLGLGLTVAKICMERCGGDIKARSAAGHGASFRLFIPRSRIQPRLRSRITATGHETILVADDNAKLRIETHDILRKADYRVYTAHNGRDCVAKFKKHADDINLTIIDVMMPDLNGIAVLNEILQMNPTALIIMTSGFPLDYVRSHLKRGAWGFAQKPYDEQQLLAVVRRMLDQKSTRESIGDDESFARSE